jgi:glutathione S-transferase
MDAWFNPQTIEIKAVQRTPEEQLAVDARTANMALYHYATCMYCARVRKVIEALHLDIERRDIMEDADHYRALVDGGGRSTVPCLYIDEGAGEPVWMYESADIIQYLAEHFGD